ncbi:MAG TPA: class I SAM-dependent RNA methyltransferase [Bryobacteraceae bacterium]|nr:class I SAM-dependent RNA methyltransferase [Bryobacteraceae bacterium]
MVGGFEGVIFILSDFDITVEKLVYGGDGLGRLDGRAVLAPFVLPGERVRLRAISEKPGLVRAGLLQVTGAAAERVSAPCPYFMRCGGCHYQHGPYDMQLSWKRAILEDQLRRIGKIEPPAEIAVVAGAPWGYRNRVQLHVSDGRLGYREAQSHKLCAIEQCPIASPAIEAAIAALREMLGDPRWPRFVRAVELFTNETEMQLNVVEAERPVARRFFDWCAERIPGLVSGALDYAAAGHIFRVSHGSFFQVNRFLTGKLVEAALEGAEGRTALDLYAGVGLFSLPLASRCASVTAVESGARAAADLRHNAERAGLNVRAEQATAEAWLEQAPEQDPPDFALLDPPRAGIGRRMAERLAALRPPRLAMVSCDPATLARDLGWLTQAGYTIERLTLVDLFPQTYHLETIVLLRL